MRPREAQVEMQGASAALLLSATQLLHLSPHAMQLQTSTFMRLAQRHVSSPVDDGQAISVGPLIGAIFAHLDVDTVQELK